MRCEERIEEKLDGAARACPRDDKVANLGDDERHTLPYQEDVRTKLRGQQELVNAEDFPKALRQYALRAAHHHRDEPTQNLVPLHILRVNDTQLSAQDSAAASAHGWRNCISRMATAGCTGPIANLQPDVE